MANSITKIDTEAISRQVYSLIEDFRTAIADVEAGEGVMTQALWTQSGAIRVDKGGTGATTPSKALENLGLLDYIVASGIEEISAAISGLSTDTGGGSGANGQLPVVQVSCQNFFEYLGAYLTEISGDDVIKV